MRKMGGIYKLLPITYAVMLIGTIAITGLGIPGLELGVRRLLFQGFHPRRGVRVAGAHNGFGYFAYRDRHLRWPA